VRNLLLLLLGLLLLAFSGAFCRIFHFEWLHPDPVLMLDVYIAMEIQPLGGGLLVFVLGLFADSFAGTPMGMLASAHLLIWMAVRAIKSLVVPDRGPVQYGILLVMSLIFSLITMLQLVVMDADSGMMWVNLKAMLPLAFVNLVLAAPVWALARWMSGSSSGLRPGMI